MTAPQHDFIVVGAGLAGIGTGIQLKKLGYGNFVLLDREDDLGGTWHVNHYPGLAVDVPTTSYSYDFAPNPHWSRLFPQGPEIKQYAADVADKYGIREHMRFNTVVDGATWDEDATMWRVTLADGHVLTTRYLITATGFLSQPHMPDIPGIADFQGTIIHTAEWDDDYRATGQRVAVIGTGATAVQLIPELAREAAELTVYQRTPIWVVPKIDLQFGRLAQQLFGRVPVTQRAVRAATDAVYNTLIYIGVLQYRQLGLLNSTARALSAVHRFVSVRDPELRRALTPDYEIGCKRPTFSNSYFSSLTRSNVSLQSDGIDHITEDGIVNADGSTTAIDTLVLATGFDLWEANFPAIEIIGREGRNLGKWWRDTRFQAYQGVSVPHFPNFLSLAGPYAFLGLNFFNTMKYQMQHMDRLFGAIHAQGATTFEITEAANAQYLEQMTKRLGNTVFNVGNCASARSYYFNPAGEATLLRPMTPQAAFKEATRFPISDYTLA